MEFVENYMLKKLDEIETENLCRFISDEIDPYLTIPLSDKLVTNNLFEYIKKIQQRADGYVVVDEDTNIVAIVAGYIRNRYIDKEVYITMFGVHNSHRNKGIGSRLMQKFLNDVPQECMVWTNCDKSNLTAKNFYFKMGFRVVSEHDERLVISTYGRRSQ